MYNESPTTRVYNNLRQKIIIGDYSPAESLIESNLANEYQISRNTMKKVILMLEQDGLVTVETNKSAKVRAFSKQEVMDFLEFRQVLEGYIVRMAVAYFTDKDIEELEEILAIMLECKIQNRLAEYSKNNRRFHDKIFSMCPNKLSVEVTCNLKNQMRKYNTRTILVPGRAEQSYAEHMAIFLAIKSKSPALAEKNMQFHLANVLKEFSDNYDLLI